MACGECTAIKTVSTGRALVYSNRAQSSGKNDVFALSPDSIIQIAPLLKRVRVTTTVRHLTDGAIVQPVFQSTEDAVEWSEPVPLSKSIKKDGTYTSEWLDDAANFTRGMRTGVIISGDGQITAMAYVHQMIDMDTQ